jgi:hypothetical protein
MNVQQQTAILKAMDAAMAKEGLKPAGNAIVDMALGKEIKTAIKSKDGSILSVMRSLLTRSDNDVIRLHSGVAKRILEEANFPRQRHVKESRLKKHRMRLESGSWRGDSFPITFALIPAQGDQPEKIWLINGQHRITVISEHHSAVPIKVIIAPVKDEEEAAKMYTYFDDPAESRTDIEVLDARGVTNELQLPRDVVRAVYGALSFLRNDLEPAYYQAQSGEAARDRDGRMHDMSEWANEARVFWQDISISDHWTKRRLLRPAITAVALFTYRYQPSRAHDFWSGVARQDGLARGDARDTLVKDFRNRMTNLDGKGNNNQRAVIQSVTMAWNAFCEKREISHIKCSSGAVIKVWGTPFANGNRR